MIHRRRVVAFGALAAAAPYALAQSDRPPIRVLVGFPPGGSADIQARLLADKMREHLEGQSLVIDNKPGAAGRIAIDALKGAAPDGQTVIVMPSGPVVLFPHVFRKLSYDPVRDLTPISLLSTIQFAITAGPKTDAKNVAEMLAKAKADPSNATFGSAGNGTLPHFLGLLIGDAAGVPLQHVPFQGGAPAMNALMGGHVAYVLDTVTESIKQHKAGKVRVIAVTGAERSPLMPEVPTLREQGVPIDAGAFFAMYGPANMAPAQVARLSKAAQAALKDPALRKQLQEQGYDPSGSTPEQLAAVQRSELAKWEKPIKASGFQLD